MAMEKSSSKYRTQFWYVAMVSFLLWLVLLYLFSSSATTVHTHERLFRQENVINLPINVPKHVQESDQAVLSVDVPQHDQEPDQPVVSDVDNNTLPVNTRGNDTSREVQISEDAKVVTDLVEELEKEKIENEKKRADSGLSGRTTWSRRGHREPRKARLEPEKKRVRHNDDDNERNVVNSDENHQSYEKELNFLEPKDDVGSKKDRVGKEMANGLSDNDIESDNNSETVSEPKNQRHFTPNKTVSKAKNRVTSRRNRPKVMVRPRATRRNDPCRGKYVYMHDVPSLFNEELLKNCWTLSRWTDMCELTSNFGLGPRLPNMEGVSGWFATNQFTLEVIFHNRMKQYKCLTKDSSLASAVYVPYYPGLDLMRFLWGPFPFMRDAAALDLMKWLRERPEWKRMDGRDHFMVAGRTTWDFMRTPGNESDWGNRCVANPIR